MNKLNAELNIEDLENVAGGMPFYGMGCSLNQHNLIGSIVDFVEGIPVVGGVLGALGTAIGRGICGG